MPRQNGNYRHTPRRNRFSYVYNAAASRPVPKSEIREGGKEGPAQKALDDEWKRLDDQGCFDWSEIFESWHLTALSRTGKRKPCHIGLVFGICVEKAYLHTDPKDPNSKHRRYKGRYVYQGNNVKDEWNQNAIFQELSCHPASMEAAKCVDAYSCLPGHRGEQDDAEQAFIQAKIDDSETETFARIPREYLPEHARNMKDPVVRVRKALYGHPDAPGLWERHLEEKLSEVGFEPLEENLPSV